MSRFGQVKVVRSYDDDDFENEYGLDDEVRQFEKRQSGRKYYPSNKQERLIVNAVSGMRYNVKVGSRDSQRLFRLVDSTGTCNKDGYRIMTKVRRNAPNDTLPNPEPNFLYFDSPEECMRHMHITLNPELVKSWRANVDKLFSKEASNIE